jgi:leader peptidase (prepilin peptidase)/N-methyltransferase
MSSLESAWPQLPSRTAAQIIHSRRGVDDDRTVKVLIALVFAVYGLVIGSFLNVVIDRVPKRESVVRPRSRCPRCDAAITSRDNIPLLSWILLRGRCRSCGLPISVHYPLVEAGTAMVFFITALHFGAGWNLAIYLVLFVGLIPLAVIDGYQRLLPIRVLYPVLATTIAILLADTIDHRVWRQLLIAVACGAVWFAAYFLINLAAPHALGFGDVRLVGLLGLSVGWLGVSVVFIAFFASNILGILGALAMIAAGRAERSTQIPYGVYLALGAGVAVLVGPSIVNHLPILQSHQ